MNQFVSHSIFQVAGGRADGRMLLASALCSNRCALVGAILFAVLFPGLLQPLLARLGLVASASPTMSGVLAAILALLVSHVCLRKVGVLPFVDDKLLIFPTFLATFGAAAVIEAEVVRDFSRYPLLSGFLVGMAWYLVIAVAGGRLRTPRLAFVGNAALDPDMLGLRIDWVWLAVPRLPSGVFGIVYDGQENLSGEWERFFARAVLRNIPVYELSKLREMALGRVRLRSHPEQVFGHLMPSLPYLRAKRAIDTALALPALVLALPVMALAALLIRLESPGPALYTQRRVGYQGRVFTCYKLRSMRTDAPGPAYTTERDPRITRVGRFIRMSRIDELPQIFNILKGEMSWIGPRPEAVKLSRTYRREIPYYAYRHAVRPGISGWAAVHQGNVALTEAVSRKLEYDFYYIKYFSVWLDMLIVLMTIRTVLTGMGSR